MGEIYYRVIFGTRRPKVALAFHRRRRDEGQRTDARGVHPAQGPAAEFCRQRRRPRDFLRQRGRDRLRRLHRQCGLEDQRGRGAAHRRDAEESAARAPWPRRWATCFRATPTRSFARASIIRNMAARRCLGVRGITVIGHGSSNANAIKNAVRVAAELARARLNEKIEQELSALPVAVGA